MTNVSLTLFKRESKGITSIDYAPKQRSAVIEELVLSYDANNHRIGINNQDFLEYKIPFTLLDQESNDFLFSLKYQSNSTIGLTNNYGVGFNKGLLNIKTATETINDDSFIFNQVMACLSRDSHINEENVFYPLIKKTISLKASTVYTRMQNWDQCLRIMTNEENIKPIFLQDLNYLKNILWDIHNSLVNDEIVVDKLKIVSNQKLKDYYSFDDVSFQLINQKALVFDDHFGYDYDNKKIIKMTKGGLLFASAIKQTLMVNFKINGQSFDYQIAIQNNEPSLKYQYHKLNVHKFAIYQQSYFLNQVTD